MTEFSDFAEFDKAYELNIGKSFQNGFKSSYHHFKYDFTPASVDKHQEAKVSIGVKNDVTIQVPHVEGSAQKYTQFTGNKQPSSTKECVLIFDSRTKEFTLERLQSNFILKRSRLEGSSKAAIINPRSITPTNELRKKKIEGTNINSTSTPNENKKISNCNNIPVKQKETNKLNRESPPKSNVSEMKTDQLFGDDLNLSDGDESDVDL